MKAPAAIELLQIPDVVDESKMSWDERAHRASLTLPKKLSINCYGLGRHLLSCALFSVNRTPRKTVEIIFPSYRGAFLRYEGPELRQDDARVLLGLIHRTRNGLVSDCIMFEPKEFTRSLGWAAASTNQKKLRDCIERMQKSVLQLSVETSGMRTHLIGSFKWTDTVWSIKLDPLIIGLFVGGMTFLPRSERTMLTDGMQTWLASFLRAQSDVNKFKLSDLLKYSGSRAKLARFGEHMRDTMPKLQSAGCVSEYHFGRGYLVVTR